MQPTIFFKLVSYSRTRSHASLVSHVLGFVQKGGVHILKVSTVSSSTRIGKSRDKSFVLDLKLLFIIVDCFSGRFPLEVFFCEIILFH